MNENPQQTLLYTLKTEINGHELNIMLDPGSTHTVISDNLKNNLNVDKTLNSTEVTVETVLGSKTYTGQKVKLLVPTKEKGIKIKFVGLTIPEGLPEIEQEKPIDFKNNWPNLNDEIQKEIQNNRVTGQIDILVGLDNFFKFVLEEAVIHPSEEFGIINTKLGWTIGGRICTATPMVWQRIKAKETKVPSFVETKAYQTKVKLNNMSSKEEIEKSLNKLFSKEEDESKGQQYTIEEQYALYSLNQNIKERRTIDTPLVHYLNKKTCASQITIIMPLQDIEPLEKLSREMKQRKLNTTKRLIN